MRIQVARFRAAGSRRLGFLFGVLRIETNLAGQGDLVSRNTENNSNNSSNDDRNANNSINKNRNISNNTNRLITGLSHFAFRQWTLPVLMARQSAASICTSLPCGACMTCGLDSWMSQLKTCSKVTLLPKRAAKQSKVCLKIGTLLSRPEFADAKRDVVPSSFLYSGAPKPKP